MQFVMLDQRDEDIKLSQGDAVTLPVCDDIIILEKEGAVGAWVVVGRTFIMGGPMTCVLLLAPVNRGEWDGSADAYLEAMTKTSGSSD